MQPGSWLIGLMRFMHGVYCNIASCERNVKGFLNFSVRTSTHSVAWESGTNLGPIELNWVCRIHSYGGYTILFYGNMTS